MPVMSSLARPFDGSPVPVVIVDPDYRVVGMNPAAERLYGMPEADALGRSPTDFIELSYLEDTASADVLAALDERGFWQGPLVQTVHDGTTHLISATLVRVRDAAGGQELTYSFLPPAVPTDRERAALTEATPEGRFRNLFEHLPEALLVQDLDGRILEVNQAAAELYGYARWDLPGLHANDITADLDHAIIRERLVVLQEHGSLVTQSVGRRADGTTFPQRVTITMVSLGGRDLVFVLARDLTEERRLEGGLAALTDLGRLQESGDTLHDLATAAVDLTVRMFSADRAALATFTGDQEVEWLAQRRMESFIEATAGMHPRDIPWLAEPLRTGIAEVHDRSDPGHPQSPVTPVADALGVRAYAIVPLRSGAELTGALGLLWSGPAPDEASQPELLASVGRLIGTALGNLRLRDSLVRRQQELDESEARYRSLFEEAPQPLLIESWDGHILDANGAAARLYRRERSSLVGLPVAEVAELDPEAQQRVRDELRERRRGVFRGRGKRADGTSFPQEVEIAVATIQGEESLLVQVRDLTDDERMQGELLQAQKMEALGQLISGVAHELNNPLSAIIAFSQLMRRDDRLPPDVHRDADLLMQEADRTRRIVQNLLDFARQRPPERRLASIRELVERTLELHAYALGVGRIEVRQSYAENLPAVDVDPGQIQQVLLNLTINAIQAIRAVRTSGTIDIDVTLEQDPDGPHETGFLRVAITDDGPGVPEPIRSRLFEPFFTTREVGQGTGLGLSVSYGIVASHGGKLWFEPAPDGGSRFVVELPAAWAASNEPGVARNGYGWSDPGRPRHVATLWAPFGATAAEGADGAAAADGADDATAEDAGRADTEGGATADARNVDTVPERADVKTGPRGVVLAVDDEPSIRTMLDKILQRAGHEVTVAASGADALEILRTLTFDVILVDHRMSGMDGIEFYERAVAIRPELRQRTVIMSGDVLNPTLREFAVENDLRLLAKPFDLDELSVVVGEVIGEAV